MALPITYAALPVQNMSSFPDLVAQYQNDRAAFVKIIGTLGEQLSGTDELVRSLNSQVAGLSSERQSVKEQLKVMSQTVSARDERISNLVARVETVAGENATLRVQVETAESTMQSVILRSNQERRSLELSEKRADSKARLAELEKELSVMDLDQMASAPAGIYGGFGGAIFGGILGGPPGALIGGFLTGVSTGGLISHETKCKQKPRIQEIFKEIAKLRQDLV